MTAQEAAARLKTYRFRYSTESELQAGIEAALRNERMRFDREVRLNTRNRIDFLLDDGVGIEVKMKGSRNHLILQLDRYASLPQLRELLLITGRRFQAAGLESRMRGKPLAVLVAQRGF